MVVKETGKLFAKLQTQLYDLDDDIVEKELALQSIIRSKLF
jgi:hypothetical protein